MPVPRCYGIHGSITVKGVRHYSGPAMLCGPHIRYAAAVMVRVVATQQRFSARAAEMRANRCGAPAMAVIASTE